jgi:fructose-1,6-bisphosphatase I
MQHNESIITIQQHILQEQKKFRGASGEFSWLLSGITLAAKLIQSEVRRAGLSDLLGSQGDINIQGEVQQKLDVYANEVLIHSLSLRESIGIIASEENEHPVTIPHHSERAHYAIVFDPLDGSSNLDYAVSVGTTFAIYRRPEGEHAQDPGKWVLQGGRKQVAAGYVVYGSSTVMVYSTGNGVHGFTLDPAIGAFVLSHENIRIPRQGKYYSVNEAAAGTFPEPYRRYLDQLRSEALGHHYSSRYVGSMIADFHRTLLGGGVFLYPPTSVYPNGKLRLLYEANPVAFLAEHAGGAATNGKEAILDLEPESIHQRTPLIVGGQVEMEAFDQCMRG